MSDLAETHVVQAEAAIQAGDFVRAMDLLRKARLLAGADPSLTSRILSQMIRIAPRVGADNEVHTWRQLLSQAGSMDGLNIPVDAGTPAGIGRLRQRSPSVVGIAKYGVVLLAIGLLAVGAWWYWKLSASRYGATPTSGPSGALGGD